MSKHPILLIVPHGGCQVPEEFAEISAVDDFNLFIEADTCANEIFDLRQSVAAVVDSRISRLFVDTDRPHWVLPNEDTDGVIKTLSPNGNQVFADGCFPDDIAVSAIIKRYYDSFHETIRNILKTGEIKLIIDCHTVMAIGPRNAKDAGMPRPLVSIENRIIKNGNAVKTCADNISQACLKAFEDSFAKEKNGISNPYILKKEACDGYIMEEYGQSKTNMLRLNISKSLFLNEKYFSPDFMKVDQLRLAEINRKIEEALKKVTRLKL
ncbi:MAG: N-formylglutamate amidohydrolase [Leptospirales bacterium]|nr:N-formylglutamate amidohydrolase [Leptospirales bacterium]